MKRVRRRLIVSLVLLIVGVLAAIIFIQTAAPQEQTAVQRKQQIDNSTDQTITLPGAKSIPVVHRDAIEDQSIWVVVSKQRSFRDTSYAPAELVTPRVATNTDKTTEEQSLRPEAATALEIMLTQATKAGLHMFMASGYRSDDLQAIYYNNYVRAYGVAEADTFSAKPGHSEHQTGLAFDLASVNRECYLETCFEEHPAGMWLAKNAPLYGFILRYPKDKTTITGYTYEPWHFRYVGTELAGALSQSGMTLDEAYDYIIEAQ